MRPSMFLTVSIVLALSCCASTAADAAKLSRVYIKDGDFYAGNECLRLWGFNTARGPGLPDEKMERLVDRLQFLGVNCLRFCGLTSQHYSSGIYLPSTLTTGPAHPRLRDGFLRLKGLLREAGIYITITISQGRRLKPDDVSVLETTPEDAQAWREAIEQLGENLPPEVAHYGRAFVEHFSNQLLSTFDERAHAVRERVATELLTLTDPVTGQPLAEDPQLALIETTNETFADPLIYQHKLHLAMPQYFQNKLAQRWNEYLTDKYGTTAQLQEAWASNEKQQEQPAVGLNADESLEASSIALRPLQGDEGYTTARRDDVLRFCAWLDIRDQRRMVKLYRELGYPGPSIHSAFFTHIEGPAEEFRDAIYPYVEDHRYCGAHDVFRDASIVAARRAMAPGGLPFWRSEGRNCAGGDFPCTGQEWPTRCTSPPILGCWIVTECASTALICVRSSTTIFREICILSKPMSGPIIHST